jgi:hypothetical protein
MFSLLTVGLLIVLNIQVWFIGHLLSENTIQTATMREKLDTIEKDVKKRGFVTPPFEAANPDRSIRGSSSHIIQRKPPDQIRNENFEKIKEGKMYGSY